MIAADALGVDLANPAERSAAYRALAEAFTYAGATTGPFRISGPEYNDAFDPGICEGACSLREAAHIEEDASALFEELMRFYTFFGLEREEGAEMPDHLSVELEFMHFLTHLESQLADRPKDLASVQLAQHDFVTRHVARLVKAVRGNLKSSCESCARLVEACDDFVSAELALVKQRADG
ncbi:MAG: molecular chaperone TorD family protein [Proteobacteria bacterium]|nr:molecular chaperone TorD family protein [Pseudomonadota bacterium]